MKLKAEPRPASVRVAIYTRKSTEEGLDQEFNSLDAQRQAVEAYVESQRGLGWVALPDRYDDAGFTGANTDRPAFQRLLADVEARRVDVVAVYKIDRLSRSLFDFTRLMEVFRANDVTFVSVTQQFSTTTSVGRMTLNLLATFAEFERETISERTRDKMGAARRKGMWTGGAPMLGFDAIDKKLVINTREAEQVRAIFELYQRHGSLLATVEDVNARGWRTKSWTSREGRVIHGERFTKHSLRRLLSNPVYLGKTTYKGELHPGQHAAIVDDAQFDAVGRQLRQHARTGGTSAKNKHGALLKGIAVCGACGSGMQYHYTQRGSRRHAYYVCSRVITQGASACPGSRAPAGELERIVVERVRAVGRDPALVEATIEAARADAAQRKPELLTIVQAHEAEAKRLAAERRNLIHAIGQGTPALGERLAEVDRLLGDASQRAADARAELLAIDGRVVDEAALRSALSSFDPVWNELFPCERARVLALLIERVEFDHRSSEVEIRFRSGGPAVLGRSA